MTNTTAALTQSIETMLADYRAAYPGYTWSDTVIASCLRSDNEPADIAQLVADGDLDESVRGAYLAVLAATPAQLMEAWDFSGEDEWMLTEEQEG